MALMLPQAQAQLGQQGSGQLNFGNLAQVLAARKQKKNALLEGQNGQFGGQNGQFGFGGQNGQFDLGSFLQQQQAPETNALAQGGLGGFGAQGGGAGSGQGLGNVLKMIMSGFGG